MPKFSAQIDIKFKSNVRSATRGIDNALAKTSKGADKLTASFGSLTSAAIKVGKVGFTIAAAGMGLMIARGQQFETSLRDLEALTGITGSELQKFAAHAKDVSLEMGVMQSAYLKTVKIVASGKSEFLQNSEALQAISDNAVTLSKASGDTLEKSTRAVVDIMNQFRIGTEDANSAMVESNRVINVLAAGAKFGASEIGDTALAMIRVGAVAKLMKIPLEQTTAAIQVLSKSGIRGRLAGTQLRTALIKLEATGIRAIMPSVVGLEKAFANLNTSGLTTTEMAKLFGLRAVTVGASLTKNVPLLGEFTKKMTGTNIAFEQADIRMQTFAEAGKRLAAAFDAIFIKAFGSSAKDSMIKFMDDLSKFLQLNEDLPELLKTTTEVTLQFLKASIPLMKTAMGIALPVLTLMNSILERLGTESTFLGIGEGTERGLAQKEQELGRLPLPFEIKAQREIQLETLALRAREKEAREEIHITLTTEGEIKEVKAAPGSVSVKGRRAKSSAALPLGAMSPIGIGDSSIFPELTIDGGVDNVLAR